MQRAMRCSTRIAQGRLLRPKLLSLSILSPPPPSSNSQTSRSQPFNLLYSSKTTIASSSSSDNSRKKEQTPKSKPKPTKRDFMRNSAILESFRLRQLKGASSRTSAPSPPTTTASASVGGESVSADGDAGEVVSTGFGELGLGEEVIGASREMGVPVPSEIQCVGIPAVLEGQSVVMSAPSGSGRTLAYLLPLLQMLRQDAAMLGVKRECPRALVLCASEESCEKVFYMAKFVTSHAWSKSSKKSGMEKSEPNEKDLSDAPIGLLVETPEEALRQIEEGDFMPTEVKYLVLEEADAMLASGLFPKIRKILSELKNFAGEMDNQHSQAVIVISDISKILEQCIVEHLERDKAGKVAAMMLEIDRREVFHILESPDALKKKVAEAVESLNSVASGAC